ncbi:MAG: hypothetical protein DHS20C21_03120 [Gemmatimonadota bacterium]|nr:MAG: hypothetical protein DHS20C21_03120 [Gemmatimonadota bacterium]
MIHSTKYKRTLYAVAELIHGRANSRWAAAEAAVRTVTDNTAFANVLRTEQGWPLEFPSHLVRSGVGARFDLHVQYALEKILAKHTEEAALEVCAMADMICVPGFGWGE